MPISVGIEDNTLLGYLYFPGPGELAGRLPGRLHQIPPMLTTDGTGRLGRADASRSSS